MWIPGHTGIKGNKITDEQASLAINNSDTHLIEQISNNNLKNYIKEIIND